MNGDKLMIEIEVSPEFVEEFKNRVLPIITENRTQLINSFMKIIELQNTELNDLYKLLYTFIQPNTEVFEKITKMKEITQTIMNILMKAHEEIN
jgi:hypothetical protein